MIWFFERSSDVLELETRFDNQTHEYIVERREPGRPRQIERYASAEAFRQRLLALETRLASDDWSAKGEPHILTDGWPDKTPLH